jgi:hypothetical protein
MATRHDDERGDGKSHRQLSIFSMSPFSFPRVIDSCRYSVCPLFPFYVPFFLSAGFVRLLELMLGQGQGAQVQGPGERVGVIS